MQELTNDPIDVVVVARLEEEGVEVVEQVPREMVVRLGPNRKLLYNVFGE